MRRGYVVEVESCQCTIGFVSEATASDLEMAAFAGPDIVEENLLRP